jgi:hypothetical protein
METLMDDISKSDLKLDLPQEEQSFSVSWLIYSISPIYGYFEEQIYLKYMMKSGKYSCLECNCIL